MAHWESHARQAVAMFRRETTRTGESERARALVEELSRTSPDFAAMWHDNEVGASGEGIKCLEHLPGGPLTLEYSTFAVSDHPNLELIIFAPATPTDEERMQGLIAES